MQHYIPLTCGLVALACGIAFQYLRRPQTQLAAPADPKGDKDALIAAVMSWWSDTEGLPDSPGDARLLQALWRYEGDHTKPCDGCDGWCDEPCAPITAKAAIASLDRWTEDWMKKRGITQHTS